jgi:hypothetical protein
VLKRSSKIQVQDCDEIVTHIVGFYSSRVLSSINATNVFVPQQLDLNTTFLYYELTEAVYMHIPKIYRDSNKVTYLKRYIYGFKQSAIDYKSYPEVDLQ